MTPAMLVSGNDICVADVRNDADIVGVPRSDYRNKTGC